MRTLLSAIRSAIDLWAWDTGGGKVDPGVVMAMAESSARRESMVDSRSVKLRWTST